MYGGGTEEISIEKILDLKQTVHLEIHNRYGINIEKSGSTIWWSHFFLLYL
jgi:hypothetical protein